MWLKGKSIAQETDCVKEAKSTFVKHWDAHRSEFGDTITVQGYRAVYMPWNCLNESAETLNAEFGYSRGLINWKVDHHNSGSMYRWGPGVDEIVLGYAGYDEPWVVAHEYTHALHHKGMGGAWKSSNCSPHFFHRVSSYRCAFAEGFANHGGSVFAPDDDYAPQWENWDNGEEGVHGKIEGYVAALFHDLADGGTEENDETEYANSYLAAVFATCYVKVGPRRIRSKRDDVSDFVWCLENRVNATVHDDNFPGITAPKSAHELATEPDDWDEDDIRSTWLLNLEG